MGFKLGSIFKKEGAISVPVFQVTHVDVSAFDRAVAIIDMADPKEPIVVGTARAKVFYPVFGAPDQRYSVPIYFWDDQSFKLFKTWLETLCKRNQLPAKLADDVWAKMEKIQDYLSESQRAEVHKRALMMRLNILMKKYAQGEIVPKNRNWDKLDACLSDAYSIENAGNWQVVITEPYLATETIQ